MIHRVVLPKFDANITEATIGEWHKSEGDAVQPDDVLVDIITDKANFELTAETGGILRKIIAPEKSQVPLGYVIALVGDADDDFPDVSAENEKLMQEYLASVTGKTVSAPTGERAEVVKEPAARRGRVRATPRARRLAREHHIDLAAVREKTGAEVVTEKEVRQYVEESKS